MFKIIKNFNWIIASSFLCIFLGILTFLTFINEGFIPLTDKNLQILLITDSNDSVINENIRFTINLPKIDESLTPFLSTIPLQLLAYHVALLKKCDIDKPRNLAKSVTVE